MGKRDKAAFCAYSSYHTQQYTTVPFLRIIFSKKFHCPYTTDDVKEKYEFLFLILKTYHWVFLAAVYYYRLTTGKVHSKYNILSFFCHLYISLPTIKNSCTKTSSEIIKQRNRDFCLL
jgi:hypothetical protein